MNIYLYKDGQQLGPFTEAEARAHLSNGSVSEIDLAWVEGNSDWQPLSTILPPVTLAQPIVPAPMPAASVTPAQPIVPAAPIPTVVQVVAPRPLSHWGVSLASWALLALCCIASLLPGLGFGVWLVAGPVLVITFVLGIIAISRGGTLQGVLILLASLIVVPVFVFIAPIVTTTGLIFVAH